MQEPGREKRSRRARRFLKLALFPFWFLFWIPNVVIRSDMEAVWGSVYGAAGTAAGIFAVVLALSIAIPVVAVVLAITLAVVPLAFAVAAVSMVFAVLTWPLRRALWSYNRRRSWKRWFYALDEPGEVEDPWRE